MKRHEAEKLIDCIQSLVDMPVVGGKRKDDRSVDDPPVAPRPDSSERPPDTGVLVLEDVDFEKLYQRIKARFIEEAKIDPVLLHLIAAQPQVVVEVEPRVVEINASSLKGRLARMMAQGFFKEMVSSGEIRRELMRTGSAPGGTLARELTGLVNDGFITREGEGFRLAPGVKASERELVAR